ncbi:DUF4870 family protein [Geopseudomonas aromaticivorans]
MSTETIVTQPAGQSNNPDMARPAPVVSDKSMPFIVYCLFLAGVFFFLPGLVGIILAYVKGGDERDPVLAAHYAYQKRTFWWATLWLFLSGMLMMAIIGYLTVFIALGWYIYRCVKGMTRLNKHEAI